LSLLRKEQLRNRVKDGDFLKVCAVLIGQSKESYRKLIELIDVLLVVDMIQYLEQKSKAPVLDIAPLNEAQYNRGSGG